MEPYRGRFAPSPTGRLHLGNLRTALAAWLFARSEGSAFLLRFEDLDQASVRPEHYQSQAADLADLGIDWDGGPVRQSERRALYLQFDGAIPGTTTLQYQVQRNVGESVVLTATAATPNLPRIMGEFEEMVASIRLR